MPRFLLGLVSACVSLGCVGLPPPAPGRDDGSGSSTTGPADTTGPSLTTTPAEGTSGTSGTGTSTSGGDTTVGVSASDSGTTSADPTTGGSSTSSGESSSSGPPPECLAPGDCPNNETCTAGDCVPACNPWGDGDYGYCLTPLGTYDSAVLCGEPLTCINGGSPTEVVVCGRTCATLCDCPEPPATGTATVTCGDLVNGGSTECYLSCTDGETCPDGMECRDNGVGTLYCTHPVQPLAMYGNCDGIAAPCIDGVCATSGTNSVCVAVCPGGVAECDPAPIGADMGNDCDTVISPPAGSECYLPCIFADDCPLGMACINTGSANICMWP
jgi:hypothetical protein